MHEKSGLAKNKLAPRPKKLGEQNGEFLKWKVLRISHIYIYIERERERVIQCACCAPGVGPT